MIKGLLLGGASALALAALFVASVSLLVPPPSLVSDRPVAVRPEAPVLRDQSEVAVRVPEPPVDTVPIIPAEITPQPSPAETGTPQSVTRTTTQTATVTTTVRPAVDLPAGSQFNRPPEDGDAITPQADIATRAVISATRPDAGAVRVDAPDLRTESAAQPQPTTIAGLSAAPEAGDAPNLPNVPVENAPQTFGSVEIVEPVNETAMPEGTQTAIIQTPAPSDSDTVATDPTNAAAEQAAVDGRDVDVVQAPSSPITEVLDPIVPERVEPEPEEDTPVVMPRRLVLDSERVDETGEDAVVESPARGALLANAARFRNPEELPLLSVVLIDDPDAGVDRESLIGIDFPVTFAVDPSRAGSAEAATAYRQAGHEVIWLADALSPNGTPQDIEVAMTGARMAVPQAIGVLDLSDNGFADNRTALEALLPALSEAGMGFVAYPGGLNSGVTAALRGGIPAATLYRVLDAEGERAVVITRYLDRATFEATSTGTAVVVGRTTPEMIAALYSWRLSNRSDQILPAPLSAVLLLTVPAN